MTEVRSLIEQAKVTKMLHLSYMELEEIPSEVWGLTGLVRLDLGYNSITDLPAGVGQLTALQELWLNGNPIRAVPAEIERCQNLKFVDLRDTEVASLPKELSRLPKIAEISLSPESISPELAAAAAGGTKSLLQHLAREDELRVLRSRLLHQLNVLVYKEVSNTERGQALIMALAEQVISEFPKFRDLRLVIRNAERLFPSDLDVADAKAIRKVFVQLQRDNEKKRLAVDVELKIRALYFDRIRVETVEGMVKSIYQHVTRLEDIKFLLHFATQLFPEDPADVDGKVLLVGIKALRKQRAEERAAAVNTLFRALCALYPTRDPPQVEPLAVAVSKLFKGTGPIKQIAADAELYFPAEFTSAKPRRVFNAFQKMLADKEAEIA